MKLLVIEAPGKVTSLQKSLDKAGIDAIAFATKGHLFVNPAKLRPLGIDSNFRELLLECKNPDIFLSLQESIDVCEHVYIATDADPEGDVIGWDVAKLCTNTPFSRIHLNGFDPESIKSAMNNSLSFSEENAKQGISRRIIDRVIGSCLSDWDNNIPVGRVQSAFLSLVDSTDPVVGNMRLELPCSDGGSPFVANLEINESKLDLAKQIVNEFDRVKDNLPECNVASSEYIDPPIETALSAGEAILQISKDTGLEIDEVYDSMQELYEEGLMSYPRSDIKSISAQSSKVLEEIAESMGERDWSSDSLYNENESSYQSIHGAHEAPHPLTNAIDMKIGLGSMSKNQSVLTALTRHLYKAGMKKRPVKTDKPDFSNLKSFDSSIKFSSLPFKRERKPILPWVTKKPVTGLNLYSKNQVLLGMLVEFGMGRPSTQVGHIKRFVARDLIDDNYKLNSKGKKWLQYTQSQGENLVKPEKTLGVEEKISTINGSVYNKVKAILSFLGDDVSDAVISELKELGFDEKLIEKAKELADDPYSAVKSRYGDNRKNKSYFKDKLSEASEDRTATPKRNKSFIDDSKKDKDRQLDNSLIKKVDKKI